MQVFGTLKLLIAFLGASWPLLGRSGPKTGPQNGPQSNPKVAQKLVQKWTQHKQKKQFCRPVLGSRLGPKIFQDGEGTLRANLDGPI